VVLGMSVYLSINQKPLRVMAAAGPVWLRSVWRHCKNCPRQRGGRPPRRLVHRCRHGRREAKHVPPGECRPAVVQMSVQQLKAMLDDAEARQAVQLIDVREESEARLASLPHFQLLPLSRCRF
jgi:hypothetical protein